MKKHDPGRDKKLCKNRIQDIFGEGTGANVADIWQNIERTYTTSLRKVSVVVSVAQLLKVF